jgi:superfamily II DNA helicase RecQ
MQETRVCCIVIDDATCVLDLAHLMEEYGQLQNLWSCGGPLVRNGWRRPPIIALTGACTQLTEQDLVSQLSLQRRVGLRSELIRRNIVLNVKKKEDLATCAADHDQQHISKGVVKVCWIL